MPGEPRCGNLRLPQPPGRCSGRERGRHRHQCHHNGSSKTTATAAPLACPCYLFRSEVSTRKRREAERLPTEQAEKHKPPPPPLSHPPSSPVPLRPRRRSFSRSLLEAEVSRDASRPFSQLFPIFLAPRATPGVAPGRIVLPMSGKSWLSPSPALARPAGRSSPSRMRPCGVTSTLEEKDRGFWEKLLTHGGPHLPHSISGSMHHPAEPEAGAGRRATAWQRRFLSRQIRDPELFPFTTVCAGTAGASAVDPGSVSASQLRPLDGFGTFTRQKLLRHIRVLLPESCTGASEPPEQPPPL